MNELIGFAKAMLGPEPGITIFLFVGLGLALWAYWMEKKKNEVLNQERVTEVREDTKMVISALSEANSATMAYKDQMGALTDIIRDLKQIMLQKRGGE